VAISPYVEGDDVYRQIHFDEPWDSPHNLQILDKMPAVFRAPAQERKENTTYYRVFVGPGTAFEREGIRSLDMYDGTANVIGVIEAGEAVPWTKPDELEYQPDAPLPPLGGIFRSESWLDRQRDKQSLTQAAMMDGSVQRFHRDFPEAALRKFILRNSGAWEKWPKID
jgi:hypothetical protein